MLRAICATALLVTSIVASAAEPITPIYPTLHHEPDGKRDYLFASELPRSKSTRLRFPGAMCQPCWGESVFYFSIGSTGGEVEMQRYDGVDITLLIPKAVPQRSLLTDERVRVLVAQLDFLYAAYRELNNGRSPQRSTDPAGKHVLAYAETLNGPAGLALIDGDIAEVAIGQIQLRGIDDDLIPNIWIHELGHNFDQTRAGAYGPDPPHDWVAVLETWFAPRALRLDLSREQSWLAFAEGMSKWFYEPYLNDPTLTWELCASSALPPACAAKRVFNPHGYTQAAIARAIGPLQTQRWIAQRYADQLRGFNFANQAELRDYLYTSLAEVSNSNTSCLAPILKWPILESTRTALSTRYPTTIAACDDLDRDGVPSMQDCDDAFADVFPGAVERADARDNDCNGTIDDVLFLESSVPFGDFADATPGFAFSGFPLRIEGGLITGTDTDAIAVPFPANRSTKVEICTETQGAVLLVKGPKQSLTTQTVFGGGSCAALMPSADQRWSEVQVRPLQGAATNYRLRAWEEDPSVPRPPAITIDRGAKGVLRANIIETRIPGGVDEVEVVWTSNACGELQRRVLSAPDARTLSSLDEQSFAGSARPLQIRATLQRNRMPIEASSNPYLFANPADLVLHTPGADVSGAWYNPTHSGEGYLLEAIGEGRVIVYWFTYDDRAIAAPAGEAKQMWFVGLGQFDGPILRVPTMQRVLDGGFGSALNPNNLRRIDVGALSLSFADPDRATVHFRVGGFSGESSLQRLSRIDRSTNARGLSGSWYDPRYSGQGLIVQELAERQLFGVLFTFDADGDPRWATVNGRIDNNGAVLWETPLSTRGGIFGRGYRVETVQRFVEGSISADLGCNGAVLRMTLPKFGTTTQTLNLVRLSSVEGTSCSGP